MLGSQRNAVILRIDCEAIRIIDGESAHVKLEFMMTHK